MLMVGGRYRIYILGADGTATATGEQNTADILAGCAFESAARLADEYTLNGSDDWILPLKDELYGLSLNKDVVGSFSDDIYRSPSEIDSIDAWF
jgi:hypothetical protein